MPTATLATLARRLARAGATTRATRGAHALALRATRVESSARANDALVARDEDVVTLTLQARPDARADVAGLLATLRPRDWTLLEHASTSRASFASAPSALVRKANGALVARLGADDDARGTEVRVRVRTGDERGEEHRGWVADVGQRTRRGGGRGGADGEGFPAGGARVRARGEFAIF